MAMEETMSKTPSEQRIIRDEAEFRAFVAEFGRTTAPEWNNSFSIGPDVYKYGKYFPYRFPCLVTARAWGRHGETMEEVGHDGYTFEVPAWGIMYDIAYPGSVAWKAHAFDDLLAACEAFHRAMDTIDGRRRDAALIAAEKLARAAIVKAGGVDLIREGTSGD
jgi:hypothetical protein